MAEVSSGERFTAASLLAMHTLGAKVVAAGFVVAAGYSAVSVREGPQSVVLSLAAIGVVAAGIAGLLLVRGDPLPLRASVLVATTGPVACGLMLSVVAAPLVNPGRLNPAIGGAVVVCAFLCVRGRTGMGWASFVGVIMMFGVWSALHRQGPLYGILLSAPNLAVLGMSSLFAFIVRPGAATIDALRSAAIREAESVAATEAKRVERDAQRAKLDELARPILELVAAGAQLDTAQLADSRLTEAQLRDSLRARALDRPDVVAAAREARRRGVEVVLLDDSRMDNDLDPLRLAFCDLATEYLNATSAGTITVRVHPRARAVFGSIVIVRLDETSEWIALDPYGRIHRPDPEGQVEQPAAGSVLPADGTAMGTEDR
ncbi:hypothetical protein ACFV24_16485 [Nocardia fluminea]|uniref:hypothetical protein n=1 Tax=Nocardia fluminea TaxID=134984 RepID=UPI00366F4D54